MTTKTDAMILRERKTDCFVQLHTDIESMKAMVVAYGTDTKNTKVETFANITHLSEELRNKVRLELGFGAVQEVALVHGMPESDVEADLRRQFDKETPDGP